MPTEMSRNGIVYYSFVATSVKWYVLSYCSMFIYCCLCYSITDNLIFNLLRNDVSRDHLEQITSVARNVLRIQNLVQNKGWKKRHLKKLPEQRLLKTDYRSLVGLEFFSFPSLFLDVGQEMIKWNLEDWQIWKLAIVNVQENSRKEF